MSSVVVLTSHWVYWGERPLKDAIKLIVKGKVEIVKADESREIRAGISRNGVTFKIPAPLVVRLLNFIGYKIRNPKISYSDEAVYARDGNICQYWHHDSNGKPFKHRCTVSDRTIDHILPVSRGGNTSFENCACSCKNCNTVVKKNRTPIEAGLKLIRRPFVPVYKRGDMAILTFTFDPQNKAHQAYFECLGTSFNSVVT